VNMACCSFDDYYKAQVGNGLPVFVGTSVQRGHGVGNVLRGLVRMTVHLVKKVIKPIAKKGMAKLGKRALSTGAAVLSDVARGRNVKRSVKKRIKQTGERMLSAWVDNNQAYHPPGRRAIKRRATSKRVSSNKVKRRRARPSKDIFS